MDAQEVAGRLVARLGEGVAVVQEVPVSGSALLAPAERIRDVARILRDDLEMAFDSLMCLSGVDLPAEGKMRIVYHLHSMQHRHKVTLRAEVPRGDPYLPSVEGVWPTANWHEREAYDILGIRFEGHPDLRRILLPEDWEGNPLRKDYVFPQWYRDMPVDPSLDRREEVRRSRGRGS